MNEQICDNRITVENTTVGFIFMLKALKKKVWLIMIITVLAAVLAYIVSSAFITPKYQAYFTANISNKNSIESATTLSNSDLSASRSLASAYAEIITSRTVLEEVAETVGLSETYPELQDQVSVSVASNTQILSISVLMDDKQDAYQTALCIAEITPEYAASILAGSSMTIIDYPCEPISPHSPNNIKNALLGALLGLLIVCSTVILSALFDNRIKEPEYLESQYGLPVIGVIPNASAAEKAEYRLVYSNKKRTRKGAVKGAQTK